MADLENWFNEEIDRLGRSELKSVYGYVQTLRDEEVKEFLISLMGSDTQVRSFADSFIRIRREGVQSNQPSNGSQQLSSNDTLTFWEDIQANTNTAPSKKSKRGKSKQPQPSKSAKGKQNEKPSFATKVKNETHQPDSKLAKAIKNSPVEQVREKIREYRKNRRVVNCIRCGKVEELIREDGACSFCGAPIFSIWEGRQEGPTEHTADKGSSSKQSSAKRKERYIPPTVVLGRYVCAAEQRQNTSLIASSSSAKEKSIQENKTKSVEEASTDSKTRTGYYRSSLFRSADIAAACAPQEQALKDFFARKTLRSGLSNTSGILLVDNIAPNTPFWH